MISACLRRCEIYWGIRPGQWIPFAANQTLSVWLISGFASGALRFRCYPPQHRTNFPYILGGLLNAIHFGWDVAVVFRKTPQPVSMMTGVVEDWLLIVRRHDVAVHHGHAQVCHDDVEGRFALHRGSKASMPACPPSAISML